MDITPHIIFGIVSFIIMAALLGFVGFDSKCKSSRIMWLIITLFTGPIGACVYFFVGRDK